MVSIGRSGKAITGIFWRQGKIRLRVEIADIKDKGYYRSSRFEGGDDLIPPA